jgi:two-component system, chemotaxis family, sensor kinase CheA
MDRDALAARLMTLFLSELEEHEQTLERDLLALEREPDEQARLQLIESVFRAAHSLKGAARAVRAAAIETLCHRLEQSLSELRGEAGPLEIGRVQALLTQVDAVKAAGARLRLETSAAQQRAGSQPIARTDERPITHADEQPLAPPSSSTSTASTPAPEPNAPTRAQPVHEARANTLGIAMDQRAARVSTQKLDALLASSSDLVVASARVESRFQQLSGLRGELQRIARATRNSASSEHDTRAELADAVLGLERTLEGVHAALRLDLNRVSGATRRVDDEVRRLRMVPFRDACESLERSVRDLSHTLDKDVRLVIEGEQVEIDRELVQRVRDPLQHLIRNAVSHGIEPPAVRVALGKSRQGLVQVEAAVRGGVIELSVTDDGRGLDLAAIRERARSLGLPDVSDQEELAAYVFTAGLSTAATVDEISGRGVGLDAVKRSVELLHGTVTVRSSEGRSTRFTLSLPLSLSKLRCMIARVAGKHYAIPTSHAVRALRFRADQLLRIGGNELVRAESELVPVASLAGLLDLPDLQRAPGEQAPCVVVSSVGRSVALVAHELLEERECIVHKLPVRVAGARYVSGATLLAEGQVALVLNGSELGRAAVAQLARPSSTVFAAPRPSRRRILVVDDSITTRALIKSIIEGGGYDVAAARDGSEALRLLHERPFDLVVSDVQMPNLDGFGLTEQIRSCPKLSRIPVILVTSMEAETDRIRGLEAGANAYLGKSAFDHLVLLELIGGLL